MHINSSRGTTGWATTGIFAREQRQPEKMITGQMLISHYGAWFLQAGVMKSSANFVSEPRMRPAAVRWRRTCNHLRGLQRVLTLVQIEVWLVESACVSNGMNRDCLIVRGATVPTSTFATYATRTRRRPISSTKLSSILSGNQAYSKGPSLHALIEHVNSC